MSPADQSTAVRPKAASEPTPEEVVAKVYASRSDWLAQAGKLTEEERDVPGLGLLLLSEVNGDVRAEIMTDQSAVLLSDEKVKKINRRAYERTLLLAGVVDPDSQPGARLPLFKPADMDAVMKVGGAKIGEVIDTIERLSLLGRYTPSAEGNSNGTPSGAGTSA